MYGAEWVKDPIRSLKPLGFSDVGSIGIIVF
jgi:hypothetical protein